MTSKFLLSDGKFSKKRVFILYAAIFLTFLGLHEGVKKMGYGLHFIQSESVQGFVYVSRPIVSEIDVGDMVIFPLPEKLNVRGSVVKEVRALSGDTLDVREGRVFINGELAVTAKPYSLKGDPLTPISSQIIPEGMIFVMGHMKDSYDSRYESFGLIAQKDIRSKGYLVF